MNGSYNLAGMTDPVVDALIEKIIAADTRPSWPSPAARSTG